MSFTDELDRQRELVACACRIAAGRGLVDGVLGHISLRITEETFLVRCRSDDDTGVEFTRPSDIRLVRFDGSAGAAGELDGYRVPNELPIHVECLAARPQMRAVAHLHPANIVAADLAGIEMRPICGAFDIPAAFLARGGVPVYPRAVLIRTRELARAMVSAMGDRPVVVCRGHGIVSTGESVQQAVLQAIGLDEMARMALRVLAAGGVLHDIDDSDWDDLPDLGPSFNADAAWRYEVARLDART